MENTQALSLSVCTCIFTLGTTVQRHAWRSFQHAYRFTDRFVRSIGSKARISLRQSTSSFASCLPQVLSTILRLTKVVGTDLERLVTSHEHPDLLAFAVLQKLRHANSSFLPFAVICIESIQLRFAVVFDVHTSSSAPPTTAVPSPAP